MRIYLAARFSRRDELRGYAAQLRVFGHDIASRWIFSTHEDESGQYPPGLLQQFAFEDWADVMSADTLIAFTEPATGAAGSSRGGRHVELGGALASGHQVIVVGHLENIFCHLPAVVFCPTWIDALRFLAPGHEATLTDQFIAERRESIHRGARRSGGHFRIDG